MVWVAVLIDENDFIRGFEVFAKEEDAKRLKEWWKEKNPNWSAVVILLSDFFERLNDKFYGLLEGGSDV